MNARSRAFAVATADCVSCSPVDFISAAPPSHHKSSEYKELLVYRYGKLRCAAESARHIKWLAGQAGRKAAVYGRSCSELLISGPKVRVLVRPPIMSQ